MNTVKILHCADIHIGAAESFLGANAESRRRETLLTFERIADLCVKENVQVLAIAGDLFDSNSIEGSFIDAVLSKIASIPQIKVIFAAGNHDPLNPQSPFLKYRLPENLFVLGVNETVLTFEDLNLKVWGRSFETAFLEGKAVPELIPENDNYINLLVQHGDLFGADNSKYNAITRHFIEKSGMDYIALGHVHKRSEIEKINNTYFAYCGCPEGQGFDELDEKGVLLGEIGKCICDLQFIPTAKRRHIHEKIDVTDIDISQLFDLILNIIKENIGDSYSDNLYKIELVGSIESDTHINLEDITARLNERVYFAKLRDNTTHTVDLKAISQEKSLKGIFVKTMLEKIDIAEADDKEKYRRALELGLKAFQSEVKFDEN